MHREEKTADCSFELGPIRPPSEAFSLLIRVTRNCPWNRCKFCSLYKEKRFQLRSLDEIKRDIEIARLISDEIQELSQKYGYSGNVERVAGALIKSPPNEAYYNVALWLYAGGESSFLQDANTLIMRTGELIEVITFLKQTFPSLQRITSYARSKTAAKKGVDELVELREAGLSRLHIGLESGYDPLLQYLDKGVSAAEHIKGGRNVVESGISLSEYVILGLGGRQMWRVLNEIAPAFIRVRTLSVNRKMPLHEEIAKGAFIRATDEQIVEEERLLIEHLQCPSHFVSDHITNLLQEIEGELPRDKKRMLACLDRFITLSPEEKTNFKLGRRLGIYVTLDDLHDEVKRQAVEQLAYRLGGSSNQVDDATLYSLMERFI